MTREVCSKCGRKTRYSSFSFNEDSSEWITEARFDSFTHSSSFVGNVRYDHDTSEMRITLNGKRYDYPTIPERIFDAFEGASSKGGYYNRNIKGVF